VKVTGRDLELEMTHLLSEIHPAAFAGDARELGVACGATARTLGRLLALIRAGQGHQAYVQCFRHMMRVVNDETAQVAADRKRYAAFSHEAPGRRQ
jgi:hypothetical protein